MATYKVRNDAGTEFDVDEGKLGDAEKDGYLPVVSNGAEQHRVAAGDLHLAEKDGYKPLGMPQDPGALAAAGRGALQGATMGFGDELAGGVDALADKFYGVSDANKKLADEGVKGDVGPTSTSETYAAGRDEQRAANKAAHDAHPWAYGTGNVLGGGAAMVGTGGVLNAGKGAGLLATMGKGALAGGVGGAGASDADTAGGLARDTAIGAGAGGALAGVGYGAGKVAGVAADKLKAFANARAVKALDPILSQQQALQDRGSVQALGNELLDNGVVGYGSSVKGMVPRLEKLLAGKGEEIGAIRDAVDQAVPEGAVDFSRLARKGDAMSAFSDATNEGTQAAADAYARNAASLAKIPQRTLGEAQGEVSALGNQVPWNKAPGDLTPQQQALRELRGDIVKQIDDKVGEVSGPEAAQRLAQLKQQFGMFKDADKILDKSTARQARNGDLGLRDLLAANAAAKANPGGGIYSALAAVGSKLARERSNATMAAGANTASKYMAPALSGAIQSQASNEGEDAPGQADSIAEYLRRKGLIK